MIRWCARPISAVWSGKRKKGVRRVAAALCNSLPPVMAAVAIVPMATAIIAAEPERQRQPRLIPERVVVVERVVEPRRADVNGRLHDGSHVAIAIAIAVT